jgi:hypothetical protein
MGIVTARRGLVVDQICIWCPDNEPTAFTQTQTRINFVEISGEILIEAIEIGENVFARHHAGVARRIAAQRDKIFCCAAV